MLNNLKLKAMKTYNCIQDVAKAMLKEKEIKIQTAYIEKPEDYSPYAIYYTRIANNKTKRFRVIEPGQHVKNCLKITFNPDRYEKEYLIRLLNAYNRVIQHWSHGTCHQHINKTTLTMVLSGALDIRAKYTEEAKAMLKG